MEQKIITAKNHYRAVDQWIMDHDIKSLLLVCDASLPFLPVRDYFEELGNRIHIVKFDDFKPNPQYESVVKGVDLFCREQCKAVIAVGGGSAMDVAKCIKLYVNMVGDGARGSFLRQSIVPNDIPFLAIPTTAGTGSEATRYAVIYYEGKKQSVTDNSCIPRTVLMDSANLKSLPQYQKKATMLDALCHAIESFWSVNSTEESKGYSREAIEMIVSSMDGYLTNDDRANAIMLTAAHKAGKAINITQPRHRQCTIYAAPVC